MIPTAALHAVTPLPTQPPSQQIMYIESKNPQKTESKYKTK